MCVCVRARVCRKTKPPDYQPQPPPPVTRTSLPSPNARRTSRVHHSKPHITTVRRHPAPRQTGTGSHTNDWQLYFQGGGWCYSDVDCWGRSKTTLGSSKAWAPTYSGMSGLLSRDCTVRKTPSPPPPPTHAYCRWFGTPPPPTTHTHTCCVLLP
jgi:hypothetical protein